MNHIKLMHNTLISFMCSLILLSVSHAEMLSAEKWSFDFNNVSIADAFNEINKQTGIEIVVRQKTIQPVMVTYHIKNQNIMQIYQDLLRYVNHTSSWKYAADGALKSIHIVILGRGDRNDNPPVLNSVNQPSGTTDEQENLRTRLVKPPEAPKMMGLRSPPMPPGFQVFRGIARYQAIPFLLGTFGLRLPLFFGGKNLKMKASKTFRRK